MDMISPKTRDTDPFAAQRRGESDPFAYGNGGPEERRASDGSEKVPLSKTDRRMSKEWDA